MEWLEQRQLLTWVATFVNSTGALTIQGVGTSSDTGVLKADPNTGEILLDGNNSGHFIDTGANLATINTTIQIEANTTINSNFIIDNNAGAFFEAPATFPANTPLFNYTGSSALNPNDSLTIRGVSGVNNIFEVDPSATSNVITNGQTTGEAGTVLLEGPTNVLNQQNILEVTYGPNANVAGTTGITGQLLLDGVSNAGGNNTLYVDDQGATINPKNPGFPSVAGTASDWTLNGSSISGPQFPAKPTVPPTPAPPAGNLGTINYANMGTLQFSDGLAGDLLTINAVGAKTNATTFGTTVVNYNQPLAFPVNLAGPSSTQSTSGGGQLNGTTGGTLDIAGALGGNNDFYIDAGTVALAATGTKPQYNVPFAHLGADLTYTPGSLGLFQVAGNGGNNIFTVQVPPVLIAPYTSEFLTTQFVVLGGSLPAIPLLPNSTPLAVVAGTNLLRVFGNAPGALTKGNDSIKVFDYAGLTTGNGITTTTNAGASNIQMSNITAVVIYGEGGNDQLTNASTGNPKQGIDPVPALLIGGSGNDTLTGGAGNDMFLGGGGEDTIVSSAVSTQINPTTTYFFPHQDQFGNIYDPLLGNSNLTTSTLTGTGGNQVVVTGDVKAAFSQTGTGDTDLGNLAFGGAGTGNANGGMTEQLPTVPPGNVTASLYMPTDALTALEQAMGVSQGPFPANEAALLEFGGQLNLRSQFATPAAFVGRAYNDFLIDRGGTGTFGNPITSKGTGTNLSIEGASVVGTPEIQYWVSQLQNGMSVQQMQAQILASDELRQDLPESSQWVRFLYQSVTGNLPSDAVLTADVNFLTNNDTAATRYDLALALLTSPAGQAAELSDIYNNVVPQGGTPSPTDQAAINADISSGESLAQVAQALAASNGNYLNYEETNNVGVVGFVAGVYEAVLHRAASAGDLAYWASVRGEGASNAQIAQAILSSPEARASIIENAYVRYLGRTADAGGMAYWQAALAAGVTDEQFVAAIVGSPEYYARNGSTSQSYVAALYRDVLTRTSSPPQQEIDYWVSQLAMSTRGAVQARADIAMDFQESSEYQTDLINNWYQIYDGRLPSATELNTALALLQSAVSDEAVQAQILMARQGS
jgi:hypothetical protein